MYAVIAGLDPAIHLKNIRVGFLSMDARVKPGHDGCRALRILHAILSQAFYGSERYCIELAVAQARAGHGVTVLAQHERSDCVAAFRRAVAQAGVSQQLRLAVMPRLPAFLQRPWAAAMIRRARPDIVHTHLNPATRRVGATAQKRGVPHVVTLHLDYEPREHAACDGAICIARWQHEALPATFRGERAVVWNWLPRAVADDLARLTPRDAETLRAQWGIDANCFAFGSVGRLMPAKGMDVLVRAFRDAFAPGENVRLVIVGDGPMRAALETLAEGDARVILAGHRSDVAACYAAFDASVSAAREEPFGLTILEAMAAGCRLVVTRTKGPQEILAGAAVHWASANDVPTLAQTMADAARGGRERVAHDLAPFGIERAAAEIEAFYARVIARKRAT